MQMDTETQVGKLDRMLDAWEGLGEIERLTLLTIAMRLKAGQRIHGKLTYAKKEWGVEALEEHLDSCVYSALRLGNSVQKAFDRAVEAAEAEVTASKAVDPQVHDQRT